jgi:hypothetical protein
VDERTSVRNLPFELGFLALLTARGVKPLSRWEDSLSSPEIDALSALGLEIAAVNRYTVFGRRVGAVVFSKYGRYVEAFRDRFDGRWLSHSGRAKRLEGWFFGYPSCCVEAFIAKPYAANGLPPDDQRILFHWACPDCSSTQSLLREYRRIYRECVSVHGYSVAVAHETGGRRSGKRCVARWLTRRALPWAASIAALMFVPGIPGASDSDPHRLPAPDDADSDGLSYFEETILGLSARDSDCDGNGIPDGEEVSSKLAAMIAALPRVPVADKPYAIEHPANGLEQCTVCGEWINMGFVSVIHPLRSIETDIPYIGLHYLEHGNIGYSGSIHIGRASIDLLKRILFPFDALHILPGAEVDGDNDQLSDEEEPLLSADPLVRDTDGDSVNDGCQVAERLAARIGALPREISADSTYVIEHPLRGIEVCSACGEIMNMGTVEIVNPREHLTLGLPYIALHYLGHGGFRYGGDVHTSGRTLPVLLSTVLDGMGHSHELEIDNDDDNDGLTNDEEGTLGLNPSNPDCDLDGMPDGPDLSKFLHEAISMLPEGPLPDQTYRVHHPTFGVYECIICGEPVNMGFMEIVDPVRGKNVNLTYYNDHFMEHGSFSTDRPGLYPREDMVALVDVLDVTVSGNNGGLAPRALAVVNAPNPFSASTKIIVNVPERQVIGLSLYDVTGRRVRALFSGEIEAGRKVFDWDGKGPNGETLPSGVYFCKLRVGSAVLSSKMLKLQ